MHELQATHLLSQQLRQDCTKAELIESYTKAYEFHKAEAARYKALLADVAANITIDLDKEKITYNFSMAEEMRRVLQKKKDQL